MKRVAILTASVLFIIFSAPSAQEGHGHHAKPAGKPITLTGEIIVLTCFMQHPASAVGIDHAKCAKACINKGLPIGFRAEDGTVYLVIGTDHEPVAKVVGDKAGKKSTITGTLIEHDGVKAIALAAVPTETATVYTCSMHPDVKQDAPGKCPKCGMTLEKVKN